MAENRLKISGRGEYQAYFNSSLSLDEMVPFLIGTFIGHDWQTRIKDSLFVYVCIEGRMDYGARLEIRHTPTVSCTDAYVLELQIYCEALDRDETLRKVSRIIDGLENKLC